eukprot:15364431-Ditylum_brightwellii.AAC.2
MAITGVENPNKLIDIKGMTKEDAHEILDGKLYKYGKLLADTESNHVGSTDNNHNIKSWHHQIIAGSSTL